MKVITSKVWKYDHTDDKGTWFSSKFGDAFLVLVEGKFVDKDLNIVYHVVQGRSEALHLGSDPE